MNKEQVWTIRCDAEYEAVFLSVCEMLNDSELNLVEILGLLRMVEDAFLTVKKEDE